MLSRLSNNFVVRRRVNRNTVGTVCGRLPLGNRLRALVYCAPTGKFPTSGDFSSYALRPCSTSAFISCPIHIFVLCATHHITTRRFHKRNGRCCAAVTVPLLTLIQERSRSEMGIMHDTVQIYTGYYAGQHPYLACVIS